MNTSKKTLVFHPGFPKTATTYLQQNINRMEEIENLVNLNKNCLLTRLTLNIFNSNKKISTKKVGLLVNNIKNLNTNKKTLFYSYEGILNPYRYNLENNIRNFFFIIDQLKYDFNIKILITIREQNEMLNSMYVSSYDILKEKFRSLDNFLKHELSIKRINKYLNYNILFNEILKNTKVKSDFLFYEDLVNNKQKYENELSEILNIKKVFLSDKKINKTEKLNDNYYVIDSKIYNNLLKLNFFLHRHFFLIYIICAKLRKYIKKKFFKKQIIKINKIKYNFFKDSNNELFSNIKKFNQKYI